MKFCATCGMPLENNDFIALNNGNDYFCLYCVDENKQIKSCEAIFNGGVEYFIDANKFTREYAEKVTRKNMSTLPYWHNHASACLKGDMITDEEFRNLFCE